MGVKFFGQLLIEQGEIDASQLRAALDLMERENQTLGELAVANEFATEEDCRRVNGEQRRLDRPFGELALEMGVLNSVELEELLQEQHRTRLSVAGALERLEFLSARRIIALEDVFKRDQNGVRRVDEVPLPGELEFARVAECLIDLLPRYCMRMARIEVKVGAGEPLEGPIDDPLSTTLGMVGVPTIEMTLASDRAFCKKLGSGIAGLAAESLSDELCLDALGEFLNVLAGNVASQVEDEGHEYRLEAPRFGTAVGDGWRFDLASEWGSAVFILGLA